MRPTPLQNSQILRSAIGGDLLATDDRYVRALTLRNRAAVHGDLPYYLLPPEIAVLLSCCHDLEKRTLFEFCGTPARGSMRHWRYGRRTWSLMRRRHS